MGVPYTFTQGTKADPTQVNANFSYHDNQIGILLNSQYQVLNVINQYGAKGDGTTDDTTAIQSAVNTASTAGGGIVWFPVPSVEYKVTTTITVPPNVWLVGAYSKIRSYVSTDATFKSQTVSGYSNVRFIGLIIQGTVTGSTRNALGGIKINPGSACSSIVIRDCIIQEFNSYGIYFDNVTRAAIEDTEIYHIVNPNYVAETTRGIGIQFGPTFSNGVLIQGGEIHGSDVGIFLETVTKVDINTIIEANTRGIEYKTITDVNIQSYFELNTDYHIKTLASSSFSTQSYNLNIRGSYFHNTNVIAQIEKTIGVTFDGCYGTKYASSKDVWQRVIFAQGCQNPVIQNCKFLEFVTDGIKQIYHHEMGSFVENIATYSTSISNAAWGKTNVSLAEDTTSDTTFIDGTAPMKITTSGATPASPARINQNIGDYRGRLVGIRFYIKTKSGTGAVMPTVAGSTTFTGPANNNVTPVRIDTNWKEITWTCEIPAGDSTPNQFVGLFIYAADNNPNTEYYIKDIQIFADFLRPPLPIATTTTAMVKKRMVITTS